ncbi:VIT family protein [uncultured archaeon]|nr:VIT family protein [uncultured archaeon]
MGSKRVDAARRAYAEGNMDAAKTAHSHKAFDEDQHKEGAGDYLGSLVYGALDGIVTTFAVVAGAAGASLSPAVIIILGVANMFADGLSMAVGTYLSIKSTQSYYEAEKKREEWEVDTFPEGEKAEIRQIYIGKGFKGKDLEKMVELITSKKAIWVDTMMAEELGMSPEQKDPVKAAGYTYIAFLVAGFIPISVFVLSHFYPLTPQFSFPISFALTFITIFISGSLRSLVIAKKWYEAGFEMLLIGGLTAVVSYGIGAFLGGLVK